MVKRVYNFNPGPAVLPFSVLEEASKGVLEFANLGMSILEISHRAKEFEAVLNETEKNLLDLMSLSSEEYKILFLQGGASLQFCMIPMNFLNKEDTADYIHTGTWSKGAIKEAKLFGNVHIAATSEDKKFNYIPGKFNWTSGASYIHVTSNNTIEGTQFHEFPDTGNVPVMVDMSSDMLSRKLDFSKFDIIYAGAQKNLGPAGVTIVVLKKKLLEKCKEGLPTLLSYKTQYEKNSLYNTPPVFAIYVVGLVAKWIKAQGGLEEIEKVNVKKAKLLYDTIDELRDVYHPVVTDLSSRSLMNIVFRMASEEIEKEFISKTKECGLIGLKGHRSVGGLRASLYNAFPLEGIEVLVDFMRKFAKS
ncbi:MAG TPA: 3-phosphoserine/phosphohydroxythreonine transaminase [Candidatus Eremiobacteraeota bacterium]|nr:MAG: Phosphoserine aminotransferase [bacterium ADurb.Bin363]HPZ08059.1 3-phosphoserine/phosphohydroxythreonine transaminase [Candidatus Eremiobacteraeota bacterium]